MAERRLHGYRALGHELIGHHGTEVLENDTGAPRAARGLGA